VFVVDTNILVYAVDSDAPHHECCRVLLDDLRRQATPWYVTWGIVYEFLRVTTHPRVFKHPLKLAEAWQFLDALLATPSLRVVTASDRHRHVIGEVFSELPELTGNVLFDAHTAILMRENGIRTIYTHDTDFNRFPFIDTFDPVTKQRRTSRRARRG
jgi:toxin-antitoxin system PIN domain toxin